MSNQNANFDIPPGFKLRQILEGGEGFISQVVWSPNGQMLALYSKDGIIEIWDIKSGVALHKLEYKGDFFRFQDTLHKSEYKGDSFSFQDLDFSGFKLAWSPHRAKIAFGHTPDISIWDVNTGELLQVLQGHSSDVFSLAWSPDSLNLASGSKGGTIRLWNTATGEQYQEFSYFDSEILVAWSPDNKTLASGSSDGIVRLWEAKTGDILHSFDKLSEQIVCLIWSPNGNTIACSSTHGDIYILSPITGKLLRIFEGHENVVIGISFSFDNRLLGSVSKNGIIRLWNCDTGETVSVFGESDSSKKLILGLSFHPNASMLATIEIGEESSVIHIWDLDFNLILANNPLNPNTRE